MSTDLDLIKIIKDKKRPREGGQTVQVILSSAQTGRLRPQGQTGPKSISREGRSWQDSLIAHCIGIAGGRKVTCRDKKLQVAGLRAQG